ncbi:hypothetical protein [Paenibacillus sp. PAMC 26794]|uniref:hypothetical protein n=1 Tax=Paenibacillus sp. PAMC 26794 TaxID=1257080 RepID=UPI0003705F6C|nr:hypothetical protein [Paenibacillus sp. PAMC 26794]
MTKTALTREQVLEMEPGEEIDTLVAEKVMCWKRHKPESWENEYWVDKDGSLMYEVKKFQPSRNKLDAWKVAESYPICRIERHEIFVGNVNHEIEMWSGFDYIDPVKIEDKIMELGISKCALINSLNFNN